MTGTTKLGRASTTLDPATMTVSLRDGDGAHVGTFFIPELPADVQDRLVLEGLAARLRRARDPAAQFEILKKGTVRKREAEPDSKPLRDPWREAAARAVADRLAERHTADGAAVDHGTMLACGRAAVSSWDRQTLGRAKTHPEVVAHYRALTGRTDTLDALFEETSPPEESRQAAD